MLLCLCGAPNKSLNTSKNKEHEAKIVKPHHAKIVKPHHAKIVKPHHLSGIFNTKQGAQDLRNCCSDLLRFDGPLLLFASVWSQKWPSSLHPIPPNLHGFQLLSCERQRIESLLGRSKNPGISRCRPGRPGSQDLVEMLCSRIFQVHQQRVLLEIDELDCF